MQHKHPWEEFFLGHQAEPSLVLPTWACQRGRWGWGGGAGRNRKAGSGPEHETLGVQRAFGQGCCLVVSPTLCLTWLWASRWGGKPQGFGPHCPFGRREGVTQRALPEEC